MIRNATAEDIPFIIWCLQSMREEADFDVANDPEYVSGCLEQLIDHPSFTAYIEEGKGVAFAVTQPTWYDARPATYEQLLYVRPEYRSSSIAPRLIRALIEDARIRGSKEIQAGSVTGFREEALLGLYKRLGFEDYRGGVRLRLM